jgi:quercetin dioxygenase-like cupin family protein
MRLPIVDWSKSEWQPVRPGIERKTFSSDAATLALHRVQPGHEKRPHSHPHEQIVYMISGRMDFHVDGEVHRLGPGGVIAIPPNAIHHGEVVGEEEAINLDVFTPRRSEYA